MSETAVEVRNVTKTFGTTVATRDISLRVGKGEFFSFLGPSGCGKTTVLRMIAGFESPTAGQILIAGQDICKMPAHKRPVNMVFQSYALFPHLSVLENICFGLRFSKMTSTEVAERSKKALSLVKLDHLSNRYPSQLSGGQQQRIALARAIVKEPAVLLLDEPLSALDPQIREEMQSELSSLQRQLGMTFIMVTHDQGEALALSHNVAVFCQGNLEQVGSPENIYNAPTTKFVAQFIGQSNLLPCTYRRSTSGLHTAALPDGTEFGAYSASETKFLPGQECFICVKPQAMSIAPEETEGSLSSSINQLSGAIVSASYKGTCTEYFIRSGELTIRAEVSHGESLSQLTPGARVSIKFSPDRTWLLTEPVKESAPSPAQAAPKNESRMPTTI
jgi:ABC-type Fe3+/spermidine/putrescine transport system ATPase subunit